MNSEWNVLFSSFFILILCIRVLVAILNFWKENMVKKKVEHYLENSLFMHKMSDMTPGR